MNKVVQNLRSRPEKERRQILHILTAMFAVCLVILWAYSLADKISDPDLSKNIEKDIEPFSNLTDDLGDKFNIITPESLEGNTADLDI